MIKRFFLRSMIMTLIITTGCADDDSGSNENESIKDQVLSGTVQDQPFTFKGGKSFFTDADKTQISIHLTNIEVGCESDILEYDLEISCRIEPEVGTYRTNIVTQSDEAVPFNFLDSPLIITTVSDTQISGKMKVTSQGGNGFSKNVFEGFFTVPICE